MVEFYEATNSQYRMSQKVLQPSRDVQESFMCVWHRVWDSIGETVGSLISLATHQKLMGTNLSEGLKYRGMKQALTPFQLEKFFDDGGRN